jgi:hypothetical protein
LRAARGEGAAREPVEGAAPRKETVTHVVVRVRHNVHVDHALDAARDRVVAGRRRGRRERQARRDRRVERGMVVVVRAEERGVE